MADDHGLHYSPDDPASRLAPGNAPAGERADERDRPAASPAPDRLRRLRSLAAYVALVAGLASAAHLEWLGALLVLFSALAGWRELRSVSRVLLVLVLVSGAIALAWAPHALLTASGNAARLAALVIAVMLLSATLGTSRDLGTLSGSLFSGRPLPRYLSVTFATGFLAIPLNFGAVGVMGTLVSRVIELRGDSAITRNAARAVLRGFAFSSISSPLSISVAITLTFLPGLHAWELISISLPFAIGYMLLGAAFREKEAEQAVAAAALSSTGAGATQLLPWLRFSAYIGAICLGVLALNGFGKIPYSRAVAISCVTAVAIGLLFRRSRGEAAGPPSMAHIGNELAIMCGSTFLGVLASTAGLQLLGPGFSLPAWAFPVAAFLVPWLLFVGGMLGVNPIVTGTMVGAVLAPIWPPSALPGLGIGMVSGWGLTVAGTPYSANSLLLSRLTGYGAWTAALRWNLVLSLCALLVASLLGAGLTYELALAR
jgi:hypothetical protein